MIRSNGTESRKTLACLQTYRTDVERGVTLFT